MKLISTEEFKKENKDLLKKWSKMTKEELLEEVVKESTDAWNMESRVQLFMVECTDMSKTNYTLDVIKNLISEKHEREIADWCSMTVEDAEGDDQYILSEVKEKAKEGIWSE